MIKDGLFNRRAYGLPAGAAEGLAGNVVLNYSAHARQEAHADRYGVAELPDGIELESQDVVEVEVFQGAVCKAVVRFPYSDDLDLVLVVVPGIKNYFVKTCWFNRANDNHKSLDRSKYNRL